MSKEQKLLRVLTMLASKLNKNDITWSLGGSLMLKLRGIDVSANDIDILVKTDNIKHLEQVLEEYKYKKELGSSKYPTEHFYECMIEGIDVDLMMGFKVKTENGLYIFDLETKVDELKINGVDIYLSSLEEWLKAYEAMNRTSKVTLIKNHFLTVKEVNDQVRHQEKIVEGINRITSFLARRDIDCLSKEELNSKYGIFQVDVLILLGNSIPYTARLAGKAYLNGLAKHLMIVGGHGHSTASLKENLQVRGNSYSEAEMLRDYLVKSFGIKKTEIILETTSTNCGDNALKALKALKKEELEARTILLMQDPTMQRRTHASFLKEWKGESTLFISYAPFIPSISSFDPLLFTVEDRNIEYWEKDRFLSLLLGEIPRLRDDHEGYGPKGKGFIVKVDLPNEVERAYTELSNMLNNKTYDRLKY